MMFRNHVGFLADLRSDLAIAAQTVDQLMPSLRLALPEYYSPTIGCYCATKQIDWYSATRRMERNNILSIFTSITTNRERRVKS